MAKEDTSMKILQKLELIEAHLRVLAKLEILKEDFNWDAYGRARSEWRRNMNDWGIPHD